MPLEVATSQGKIARAAPVLTGFEHSQPAPWSLETAVVIVWSSDHAYQMSPFGATDTFGKLWSRFVEAEAVLHGIGWSVQVVPPSEETARNASLFASPPASEGATNDW